MDAILVPEHGVGVGFGCLNEYLENNRATTKKFLPGDSAIQDSKIFESNVLNITTRLESFLSSKEREIALLVLGKIQSGKTANLLGTVAWAADSRVSLGVIFTGVTEALNLQTEKRLRDDLLTLNNQYVKICTVPTNTEGKNFEELFKDVSKWVGRRMKNDNLGMNRPLPVLVTLKNPSRVKTLKVLIEKLQEVHGESITTLLIDDEADQASQNAKARKREVSETYAAIRALRDLQSRNILLSYTATPQAVMLTEKSGRLRPNYCVTVEPRSGYFGLSAAVSHDYKENRLEVVDWVGKPSTMKSAPLSLRSALVRFSWTSWIRFHKETLFYAGSGFSSAPLKGQLQSVQMLVHESGAQKEHSSIYRLVRDELDSLVDSLTKAATGQLSKSAKDSLIQMWKEDLIAIREGLPKEYRDELNVEIDDMFLSQVLNLFDDTAMQVVNSDKSKPGRQGAIPVTKSEWEEFKLWILIGGDILGRGLTIPQLTATYFLRHPKSPNFDTVSQQMRFCGYRTNYSHFTYLFAENKTFGIFEVMDQIDSAIWRRAKIWDKEHLDILTHMPVVMYAAPPNVKLDPCRKAVQDPNLVDKKITGEYIFSLSNVMNPIHAKQNIPILRSFIQESLDAPEIHGDWLKFSEPSDQSMQRILSSWVAEPAEQSIMIGAAELFVEELLELGLSSLPRNVLIHKDLVEKNLTDIQWIFDRKEPSRRVANPHPNVTKANWAKAFEAPFLGKLADITWPQLSTRHIGGGQRSLRKKLSDGYTTLLIEPMLGHTEGESVVSAGIAVTLFSPDNYEVRIIGPQARINSLGKF
jgi:hypothetical protein